MRFGLTVPNFGAFFDARLTAGLARDAEDLGWDGFFVWDHVHAAFEKGQDVADPWVLLTAIALRTRLIRLGALVTPLPRRRPWVVARQTATIDHLSGGRLVVGVGLGYPPDLEYAALGESADGGVRAAKLDEGLDVLTRLWTGKPVSFSGAHYTLREVVFRPKPVQSPRIPIWVGGMWPNLGPFRRAAQWDGIVPIGADGMGVSAQTLPEIVAFVRERRVSGDPPEVVSSIVSSGDARTDADLARRHEAAGATWLLVGAFGEDALRDAIRRGPRR